MPDWLIISGLTVLVLLIAAGSVWFTRDDDVNG